MVAVGIKGANQLTEEKKREIILDYVVDLLKSQRSLKEGGGRVSQSDAI